MDILSDASSLFITAFLTDNQSNIIIKANDIRRDWIANDTGGNAYRCVPMNMASSIGWSLLAPFTFTVMYDGERLGIRAQGSQIDATRIVTDQFGGGIFTFYLGLVFRSSPGHNLLVTGPINCPRRGASPLTGIVETDWAEVNFTMNWKITELNFPVTFNRGEPFCTFFPYPRHYAESFTPQFRQLNEDPGLQARYEKWLFNRVVDDGGDGNYSRGLNFIDEGRGQKPDHQRRIEMPAFSRKSKITR